MIEVRQLTKRYGSRVAVDALTFDVRPRVVRELGSLAVSLEEAFLDLTGASAEYRASWS